eukprot:6419389-Amphidinium_carterae.1
MAMAAALGASATSLQHMARQVGPFVHRYLENAPVAGLTDAVRIPTTPKSPGTPTTAAAAVARIESPSAPAATRSTCERSPEISTVATA